MKIKRFALLFLFFSLSSFVCFSQTAARKAVPIQSAVNQAAKSSPAYAEILLQKTELESQLEDFLGDYTEDFPKVKELRFQLGLIQKETDKLLAVNSSEANKLTLALGKLILRKIELQTNLWNLQKQYVDEHPEVKKAKRKIAVYDRAIMEILP